MGTTVHMSPQRTASPKIILLIDDDAAVVEALSSGLRRIGYTVLTAATKEQAIAAVKGAVQIDLLLVDAVMPEMSGPELAEILLILRPRMKVIFITGLDGLTMRLAFDRPCLCVQKPFTLRSLAPKIKELLEGAEEYPSGSRPAQH
jgi:two-component system cell cycle sensor histidine kinase/response regulator CckA